MKKSKEQLMVELVMMKKEDVIQLFLLLSIEHKKALEFVREVTRGPYKDSNIDSYVGTITQRARAILEESSGCGSMTKAGCNCGPIADND